MYNVRIFELAGPATATTSYDYYNRFDAVLSAAIDLGVRPEGADYIGWFEEEWETVAPGVRLYYSGKSVAVIRNLDA